ncbi:MAG: spore coat protein [Bacilli bacterium]|nr:spore coat protein [Bacilli bacterium]
MNDQLIMNNYLLVLKSTTEVYVHGTLESSNVDIRELLKEDLNTILTSQANTYDNMVEFGWYKKENITASKISQTIKKLNN